MIKQHEFNTEWWGDNVGIVTDPAFFDQPASEQQNALEKYSWVEFVQPSSKITARLKLQSVGFFHADTQLRFRLELPRVLLSRCASDLQVHSGSASPLQIDASSLQPFIHERFYQVPGVTPEKVLDRYVRWSNALIRQHPKTCFQLTLDGVVQGWFLSQPQGGSLDLTLAMLSSASKTSGYDLYSAAIAQYAQMGFRLGSAGFSVTNTAVHNIYAAFGARFLEPRECWLWLKSPKRPNPLSTQ